MSQDAGSISALRVVADNVNYQDAIVRLGHHVIKLYANTTELIKEFATLQDIPDIIITNTTRGEEIRAIHVASKQNIPLVIVSKNVGQLEDCEELTFVYGVCGESELRDQEVLNAVLLLATVRFKNEVNLHLKLKEALEEAGHLKTIQQACSVLYDHHLVGSMTEAYKYLQTVAASYSRPLHVQAELIVKADATMHPKQPSRPRK